MKTYFLEILDSNNVLRTFVAKANNENHFMGKVQERFISYRDEYSEEETDSFLKMLEANASMINELGDDSVMEFIEIPTEF